MNLRQIHLLSRFLSERNRRRFMMELDDQPDPVRWFTKQNHCPECGQLDGYCSLTCFCSWCTTLHGQPIQGDLFNLNYSTTDTQQTHK